MSKKFKQIEVNISIPPFKVKAYQNLITGKVQIDADDLCQKLGADRIKMDVIARNFNALNIIPGDDIFKKESGSNGR